MHHDEVDAGHYPEQLQGHVAAAARAALVWHMHGPYLGHRIEQLSHEVRRAAGTHRPIMHATIAVSNRKTLGLGFRMTFPGCGVRTWQF